MAHPLEREEMLVFVRQRLEEVDLQSKELEGIDMAAPLFQLGVRLGRESAYHDCWHMLMGYYGDDWVPPSGPKTTT